MAIETGPTTPGAGRADLNGPPPAPPSMRSPDYTGLADNPQATPQGGPSMGLVKLVIEQAQILDSGVTNLAKILPTFAPIAAQIQAAIKQAVAAAVQQVSGGGGAGGGNGGGAPAPGQ